MSPADIAELTAAAALPSGYEWQVAPQRQFRFRNLWSIRVIRDGERAFGRAAYPNSVPAAIVAAMAWAWADSRTRVAS